MRPPTYLRHGQPLPDDYLTGRAECQFYVRYCGEMPKLVVRAADNNLEETTRRPGEMWDASCGRPPVLVAGWWFGGLLPNRLMPERRLWA